MAQRGKLVVVVLVPRAVQAARLGLGLAVLLLAETLARPMAARDTAGYPRAESVAQAGKVVSPRAESPVRAAQALAG